MGWWRWRQHGPLKCSYPTSLHGNRIQKTITWIITENLKCHMFVNSPHPIPFRAILVLSSYLCLGLTLQVSWIKFCVSHLSNTCCMSCNFNSKNIWWKVQTMKLLITCYIIFSTLLSCMDPKSQFGQSGEGGGDFSRIKPCSSSPQPSIYTYWAIQPPGILIVISHVKGRCWLNAPIHGNYFLSQNIYLSKLIPLHKMTSYLGTEIEKQKVKIWNTRPKFNNCDLIAQLRWEAQISPLYG